MRRPGLSVRQTPDRTTSFPRLRVIIAAIVALALIVPLAGTFVLAQGNPDRYVAPAGSDADNNCTTESSPCKTIQHAVDVAAAGDTIQVKAGTYAETVTIDKQGLTLEGANAGIPAGPVAGTRGSESIIRGAVVLGGSSANVTIDGFRIETGATIQDELAGIYVTGATTGHTIRNNRIYGTDAAGSRGILLGRNVNNVTILNNDITQWETGIYINPSANTNIADNNIHGNGSGIDSNGITSTTITGNAIVDNGEGFGVSFAGENVAVHFNRFAGNDVGLKQDTGLRVNAENNWWGCNEGPGGDGCDTTQGDVDTNPWLTLTIAATPSTVAPGGTAEVAASLTTNSAGADTSSQGTVPDGTPVQFAVSDDGASIEPTHIGTSDGEATTTFTAGPSAGTATVSATVDEATESTSITVGAATPTATPGTPTATPGTPTATPVPVTPTAITLEPESATNTVFEDHTVTATVTGEDDQPAEGVTVAFTVTGANTADGEEVTGADGTASFTYTGEHEGDDTITATVTVGDEELTATATKTWEPVPVPPAPNVVYDAAKKTTAKAGCTFYSETGHNLCAGFRAYWEQFGGLAIYGYPLTEEFVAPDTGYVTQYFERARFEWHPGEWPERYDVMLGLLGNELTADRQGEASFRDTTANAGCTFYPETNHNLCAGFRAYWEQYGGLAVYGYPLSEEFREVNPDTGKEYTVQYFERQRFEWHPGEWPERYDVMLGRLGAQILAMRYGVDWYGIEP